MNYFAFSKILLRYFKFLFHLEFPYFLNTYVRFGQIQYFFNTLNTAWEPCIIHK